MNKELLSVFGANSIERVNNALRLLKAGNGILLVDNENRENEGDLIFSAEKMTEKDMALMIRECSGIVCLCLTSEKAKKLNLNLMVNKNTSKYGTNFTVSIEAAHGVTTGVSAHDRIATIKTAIAEDAKPDHLNKPGHTFPLISKDNGVFEREGHTEGSVDLMKLAGLPPYAVLCELTNVDGTMAKLPEVICFAKKLSTVVVSIEDIKNVRSINDFS